MSDKNRELLRRRKLSAFGQLAVGASGGWRTLIATSGSYPAKFQDFTIVRDRHRPLEEF
jgi:hypothetical protein